MLLMEAMSRKVKRHWGVIFLMILPTVFFLNSLGGGVADNGDGTLVIPRCESPFIVSLGNYYSRITYVKVRIVPSTQKIPGRSRGPEGVASSRARGIKWSPSCPTWRIQ